MRCPSPCRHPPTSPPPPFSRPPLTRMWHPSSKQSPHPSEDPLYDGAEISELIGLFMLNETKNNISGLSSTNNGLYRDGGLIMLTKCPGPKREKIKKDLHKLFRNHGLKITIASTGPVANYLDVTLDLSDGTYRPYRKPKDSLVYINAASNHPPSILKHVPKMVELELGLFRFTFSYSIFHVLNFLIDSNDDLELLNTLIKHSKIDPAHLFVFVKRIQNYNIVFSIRQVYIILLCTM